MSHSELSHCLQLCGFLQLLFFSIALKSTSIPPLIDVPTYSLSTRGRDASHDTMNILTYASPVSIKPHRMWSISLYKGTLSHENFARERRGVLQLLAPEHAKRCGGDHESDKGELGALVQLLGGSSGKDVNKRLLCERLGYTWRKLDGADIDEWPCILPGCIYYMQLELEGNLIDCGSHEVALCRVVSMVSDDSIKYAADELSYLSTRKLREVGVISELGRIIESKN